MYLKNACFAAGLIVSVILRGAICLAQDVSETPEPPAPPSFKLTIVDTPSPRVDAERAMRGFLAYNDSSK